VEQLVKLKNGGTETYRHQYGAQEVIEIAAGDEMIVPLSVMCSLMGHPDTRNSDRWREREEMHEVLLRFYGGTLPSLEAYTLDGERIITIIDDETGYSLTPDPTDSSDVGVLQRQIDELNAKIDDTDAGDSIEDVPTDEPTKVPTGRSRKR
jgi:hypothetical protein